MWQLSLVRPSPQALGCATELVPCVKAGALVLAALPTVAVGLGAECGVQGHLLQTGATGIRSPTAGGCGVCGVTRPSSLVSGGSWFDSAQENSDRFPGWAWSCLVDGERSCPPPFTGGAFRGDFSLEYVSGMLQSAISPLRCSTGAVRRSCGGSPSAVWGQHVGPLGTDLRVPVRLPLLDSGVSVSRC